MDTPIHEIVKNSRETICISRYDFKGHDVVNLPTFFDARGGEMRLIKQGVAFRAALLPDVLEALRSLQKEGAS